MYQNLVSKGIKVPNGFAITAYAYRYFLKYAGIEEEIKKVLKGLDTHDLYNLMAKGREVREIITHAEIPPDLTQAIYSSYDKLGAEFTEKGRADYGLNNVDVAIRSSATAEDLPDASLCGSAGYFLEYSRAKERNRRMQEVLCQPVYQPRHLVPSRQRLWPV